jgi:hypothetical protein
MIRNTVIGNLITFGGKQYRPLFPDLFRPLTDDEDARQGESIRRIGIKYSIFVDEDGGIVDGFHRLRHAARQDLKPDDVPFVVLPPGTTLAKKKQLAESLNADRRQMTPEDIERRRLERIRREVELKGQGKTNRQIGEEVGVSHVQVKKDLDQAAAASGNQLPKQPQVIYKESEKPVPVKARVISVESEKPPPQVVHVTVREPEKTLGSDGKRYPTHKQPAPTPEAKPAESSAAGEDDGHSLNETLQRRVQRGKAFGLATEAIEQLRKIALFSSQPERQRDLERACEAIRCLMRIPKNNEFREEGFRKVTDWIRHNVPEAGRKKEG